MEGVSSLGAHVPSNVNDSVTHGLPVGETLHKDPKRNYLPMHMSHSLVDSIYVLEKFLPNYITYSKTVTLISTVIRTSNLIILNILQNAPSCHTPTCGRPKMLSELLSYRYKKMTI
jgi:hypothetical protein